MFYTCHTNVFLIELKSAIEQLKDRKVKKKPNKDGLLIQIAIDQDKDKGLKAKIQTLWKELVKKDLLKELFYLKQPHIEYKRVDTELQHTKCLIGFIINHYSELTSIVVFPKHNVSASFKLLFKCLKVGLGSLRRPRSFETRYVSYICNIKSLHMIKY